MMASNGGIPFSVTYLPLMIRLECREEVLLPDFLGSTLHGALGWALLGNKQLYRYLFENWRYGGGKQDIVNPYVLAVPRSQGFYHVGDTLMFQLVLIGTSVDLAAEIIQTLADNRFILLGVGRRKFEMTSIFHGGNGLAIWSAIERQTIEPVPDVIGNVFNNDCQYCSIQLLTPLRIRRGGELLTDIDFPVIIRNIVRRVFALTERYGGSVNKEQAELLCRLSSDIQTVSRGIEIKSLQRYSSRKGEKMDFSGVLGVMMFHGDITSFVPWLHVAKVLHIGRNVTLGFGELDVVVW